MDTATKTTKAAAKRGRPELGARIIRARQRRGWRAVDLACYARVAPPTLSLAEAHGILTARTAEKLATVLGLDPAELTR